MNRNDKDFNKFHKENPKIYDHFRQLALYIIRDKKKTKLSGKTLIEYLRWNSFIKTTGSEFKINNTFTSYYVRLFSKEYPAYKDYFEQRKSQADLPVQTEIF